jgi:protein translocase SecG subunit
MMDADQIQKLLKRVAIAGAFFLVAFLLYILNWRSVLIGYGLLVTIVMILSILLQSGRGGGLASMGGMGDSKMLGARAATPIAKATYIMGGLFLFICMLVARLGNIQASSPQVLKSDTSQKTEQTTTTKDSTTRKENAAETSEGTTNETRPDAPAAPSSSSTDETSKGDQQ